MAAFIAIPVAVLALVEVGVAWSFHAALAGTAAAGAIALSALALASDSSATGLVGGGLVILSAGLLVVGRLVEAALTAQGAEPSVERAVMDTRAQDDQDDA
ncbi:MAG: hypothetical protein H0W05_05880 [Thermoleophilaceae bacterium]|nr:hypothetical protein [Thermoleophilaceae bacterium]